MSEFSTKSFSVDTESNLLFDVLRNKIYSDPIASIVQEIISNARDAHREINSQKPIDVEISRNFFSVRDYGLGISPERMENIFLKYLATTKKGDDKQTGGFGLGAKTPFAYADSFEITTIFEGTKYQYLASIGGEVASGEVILLGNEATTEPNGTKIKVPLKYDGPSLFRARFDKFSEHFNYPINFSDSSYRVENKSLPGVVTKSAFNQRNYNTPNYLVMDGIYYPMDNTALSEIVHGTKNVKLKAFLSHYNVVLNFDSRSLDVSVNRELLRYTPRTKASISDKLIEFIEDEDLKASKLIDSLEPGDFIKNSKSLIESNLGYYFHVYPNQEYFRSSINGYFVYDGSKSFANYYSGFNVNNFDTENQIVYLDKKLADVSFASVKRYLKDNDISSVIIAIDDIFDNEIYGKASNVFDQKKETKQSNHAKKIFFKLGSDGTPRRIKYSDIESGKTNILVPYDESYGCEALLSDKVQVFALKEPSQVKEVLKTEFSDLASHLEKEFPEYKEQYIKYMYWKRNPSNHDYYSYRKFDGINHVMLFLQAYSKRFNDQFLTDLLHYNNLVPRSPESTTNRKVFSMLKLFEQKSYPYVDEPDPYLSDDQIKRLEIIAKAYLQEKVPLINYIQYNSENVNKIIALL